jgi:hypothetical protein
MNEMGGACGMYGERVRVGLWWCNVMERDHLYDPGVDGMILK